MISETRTCIICKEEFQIYHPAQRLKKYCSANCSDSKWQARKIGYTKKKK